MLLHTLCPEEGCITDESYAADSLLNKIPMILKEMTLIINTGCITKTRNAASYIMSRTNTMLSNSVLNLQK